MTIGNEALGRPRRGSFISTNERRGLGLGLNSSVYKCFQNYYHGHKYLTPDPLYIANVRLSINHWQIRDLVQVDAATGSVFHTSEEAIRVLSKKTRLLDGPIRSRNHLLLPYRPRCFHHATGGLVVAGGVTTTLALVYLMTLPNLTSDVRENSARKLAKGLFSIYSPAMGGEMLFQLGDMINNAVRIYPQQNSASSYTAYACNNDCSLYLVDVSDLGIKGDRHIVCDANTSLNNVHQAPNQRTLTVTGDSGNVFLIDPLLRNPVYQTIETGHDSGFGISYHSNEAVFAAAFQNGTCSLFDVRNTAKPIHEVKSTRFGQQSGAFRTCRFLNSPMQDLLVVLEHLGRVHLVDMRDFSEENHQVVVFPFALDQYARYKAPLLQLEDDFDTDMHLAVSVYNDGADAFTAPLVYDYEYLTDMNPKLFKGFTYEPPCSDPKSSFQASGELNNRGFGLGNGPGNGPGPDLGSSRLPLQLLSESGPATPDRLLPSFSECVTDEATSLEETRPHTPTNQSHVRHSNELYQQALNHINGEMEISGLDWYDNQLYVGCEDGGLLVWDVNVRARRSFGSFSYV